jgi:tetratricopeptide (TPR) repeat protein
MTDELADNLLFQINKYLSTKDLSKAYEDAQEILRLAPSDPIAYYALAKTKYFQENYEDCLYLLSKAAELDQRITHVWVLAGYCLIAQRQYPQAQEAFDYTLSLDENNFEAIFGLFLINLILLDENKAQHFLERAFSINKSLTIYYTNLFFEEFFSPSKALDKTQKEDISILLKRLTV